MTPQTVLDALVGCRFSLENEKRTQIQIAAALTRAGLAFEREVPVCGGVIDFMVGPVGVEVKLRQSQAQIVRQVQAYAGDDRIDAIILAAARPVPLPASLRGKPVRAFNLSASWL